ncbi:MAG: hypothetical protein ACOH10_08040 [Rhodoglobus sp.]
MTAIAARLNAWLSPTIRKRIHALVAAAGMVAIIWGLPESLVTSWTALALGAAGIASAVLASIMARRADYTALYAAAGLTIAALVTLRFLDPAIAQQVTQTLAVVVTALGGVATMRTDKATIDGAPTAEVVLSDPAPRRAADPEPVVPTSVVRGIDGTITTYWSDDTHTTEPGA